MKKYLCLLFFPVCIFCALCSCATVQQRGMAGAQYVSTSNPTIAIGVSDELPLLSGGSFDTKLTECGVLGGLSVNSWLATFGNQQLGPLTVIAHAELPARWYWDAVSPHPFSVESGTETIGDLSFEAWTYVIKNRRNAFWMLSDKEDANAGRWIVRCFARRTDFDRGKLVLEYRERLPENIESLTSLPFGHGDFLKKFAERARSVFKLRDVVGLKSQIIPTKITGIRRQYLDEKFWGTASPYAYYDKFH